MVNALIFLKRNELPEIVLENQIYGILLMAIINDLLRLYIHWKVRPNRDLDHKQKLHKQCFPKRHQNERC